MKNAKEYINSGVIEAYVLGMAEPEEIKEVEEMAALYNEVRDAIDEFSTNLEKECLANTIEPDLLVKPLLMATVNYMQRMEAGEAAAFPPPLHKGSKISDYAEWLNRQDMVLPANYEDEIFARIIGYTPEATTVIAWLKHAAPDETHHNEHEKFLVVEGSCDITIEDEIYHLVPGDFLEIPLYKNHRLTVTSNIPCKVILQRAAA